MQITNTTFMDICISCFVENVWWVAPYAGLVLVLWFSKNYDSGEKPAQIPNSMLPNSPSDLASESFHSMVSSFGDRLTQVLDDFLEFFRPHKLRSIVTIFLQAIEWIYGIRGNNWDYLRSFKTALVFYFILIPLPAAFLPPVGGVQIAPSPELLVATIILILANALGDMFSVNCSSKIIRSALRIDREHGSNLSKRTGHFGEVRFYCTLLLDLLIATLILILVLMASSIMYGVQIGEFGLDTDLHTIGQMWNAALNFDRLFSAFYWFANDPEGFLGQPGIPGMVAFSITTYLPTLLLGCSAIIWLLVLPIRILLSSRLSKLSSLVASQVCVMTICVCITVTRSIDLRAVYSFVTTT